MIIGIPKEIKIQEYRVALTPSAVAHLKAAGHILLVQKGAGLGAGFTDLDYKNAGAQLISKAVDLWKKSQLIVKVKEPLPEEYSFFRPGLILFTFLHLASDAKLALALMKHRVSAIGYETVFAKDHSLPLLKPMSEIAGKLSVLLGARYLQTDSGKKGILLSYIEGARRGRVLILGAGNVGRGALEVALGLGAQVTVMDVQKEKLLQIRKLYTGSFDALDYQTDLVAKKIAESDLVIGAVLIPGAKAPKLVTRAMISKMQAGSVIVDVSVDQGGCIESTRPTSLASPTYTYKGIIHCGVTNLPSLVAHTATEALNFRTLPYIEKLAAQGLRALKKDAGFQAGLQVWEGEIVNLVVRNAVKN